MVVMNAEQETKKECRVIPCEVYSRIVGYYRPVQFWNPSKRQEFKDRKMFNPDLSQSVKNLA